MAERSNKAAARVYIVTVEAPYRGLNVRSGPGMGFPVLKVVPNGAEVAQDGRKKEGWVPTGEGWVDGQYLTRKDG